MKYLSQSPTDSTFVQNPYGFYEQMRPHGDLVFWEDYKMPCALSHRAVNALLRDRRFGREIPADLRQPLPDHLKPFYKVEDHSMLELEPPTHSRLRSLVVRAFTSRRIQAMGPESEAMPRDLIAKVPDQPFDLLTEFAQPIPVIVICRLLGVPEDMAPQLLRWSNDMVAMYQARRDLAVEERAAQAASEISDFLTDYINSRRKAPKDDLISKLIEAEEAGEKLSTPELITTCILLLNAGHDATGHGLGNGVKTLLEHGARSTADNADTAVEEILRYDPPLHMFTRYAYEEVTLFDHTFQPGDQVALLLGAANRDPQVWENPQQFDPARAIKTNTSFGAGLHFCLGAPLARLEMSIALPILFDLCPDLKLTQPAQYANAYHFHGLEKLMVSQN
jgi:cytochrome P450